MIKKKTYLSLQLNEGEQAKLAEYMVLTKSRTLGEAFTHLLNHGADEIVRLTETNKNLRDEINQLTK